jgi:hypothetical protein
VPVLTWKPEETLRCWVTCGRLLLRGFRYEPGPQCLPHQPEKKKKTLPARRRNHKFGATTKLPHEPSDT